MNLSMNEPNPDDHWDFSPHRDPLLAAIFNGDLEAVKRLVESGSDARMYEDYPIRLADDCDYPDIVEYLQSKGRH